MKRLTSAIGLGVLGLLLAAGLAACAGQGTYPLALTQKDSGSTQSISVGQQLHVTLDSNPTTGYRWSVDGSVPAQLEQVGEPRYTSGSSAIGAGGTEVWTFAGKSPGQGVLKLKYWRSFEPTVAPVKTFDVTVDVK